MGQGAMIILFSYVTGCVLYVAIFVWGHTLQEALQVAQKAMCFLCLVTWCVVRKVYVGMSAAGGIAGGHDHFMVSKPGMLRML